MTVSKKEERVMVQHMITSAMESVLHFSNTAREYMLLPGHEDPNTVYMRARFAQAVILAVAEHFTGYDEMKHDDEATKKIKDMVKARIKADRARHTTKDIMQSIFTEEYDPE